MLPRSKRLSKTFFKVPRGTRVFFEFGTLQLLPHELGVRAAVAVSKKTCPTAPDRNKLRRRIYHALRNLIQRGVVTRGIVVYPNRSALNAPFEKLERALARALAK